MDVDDCRGRRGLVWYGSDAPRVTRRTSLTEDALTRIGCTLCLTVHGFLREEITYLVVFLCDNNCGLVHISLIIVIDDFTERNMLR